MELRSLGMLALSSCAARLPSSSPLRALQAESSLPSMPRSQVVARGADDELPPTASALPVPKILVGRQQEGCGTSAADPEEAAK